MQSRSVAFNSINRHDIILYMYIIRHAARTIRDVYCGTFDGATKQPIRLFWPDSIIPRPFPPLGLRRQDAKLGQAPFLLDGPLQAHSDEADSRFLNDCCALPTPSLQAYSRARTSLTFDPQRVKLERCTPNVPRVRACSYVRNYVESSSRWSGRFHDLTCK